MAFNIKTAKPLFPDNKKKGGFDISTARPINDPYDITKSEEAISQSTPLEEYGGQEVGQVSPLSIGQRTKLSFGDTLGRKNWLEKNFGDGNVKEITPNKFVVWKDDKWYAVDPNQDIFADVPGDVADIIGDLPEVVGSAVGATIPWGIGFGQAAGRAVKNAIGAGLGVQTEKSILGNILDPAISGAVAGGLNVGLRVLGKLGKSGMEALEKSDKALFGLSDESLNRIREKGISKIITPEKSQPGYLDTVAQRAKDGLDDLVSKAHESYSETINKITTKNPNIEVKIGSPLQSFVDGLKKDGYIDKSGKVGNLIGAESKRTIQKIFNHFRGITKDSMINLQESQIAKGNIYRLAKQAERYDGRLSGLIKGLTGDIDDQMVKSVPKLRLLNAKYAEAMTLEKDLAKRMGGSKGAEKLDIAQFNTSGLKTMLKKGNTTREELLRLNSKVAPQYKFVDDFLDGSVAEEMASSKGFWEVVRNWAGKSLYSAFETPMKIGQKAQNKISPIATKFLEKIGKPATTYVGKPIQSEYAIKLKERFKGIKD